MSEDSASIKKYSRRWFLAGTVASGAAGALGVRLATPRPGPLVISSGTVGAGRLRRLVADWNLLHSDTPAVVDDVGDLTDEQVEKMRLRADQGWVDVLLLDLIYISEFAGKNWIAPISVDPAALRFLDAPLRSCHRSPDDDTLFALPFNTDVGLVFARDDLDADQVNLGEIVTSVASGSGRFAAQLGAKNEAFFINVLEHMLAANPALLSEKGQLDLENLELWQNALNPLQEALADGKIHKATDESKTTEHWRNYPKLTPAPGGTRTPNLYMRNWLYYGLNDDAADRGIVIAAMDAGVLGGQNLAVAAKSRRQADALELVKFLTTRQSQNEVADYHLVPAHTDFEVTPDSPLAVVLKGIASARPRPITPHYTRLSQAFQNSFWGLVNAPREFRLSADTLAALRRARDGKD